MYKIISLDISSTIIGFSVLEGDGTEIPKIIHVSALQRDHAIDIARKQDLFNDGEMIADFVDQFEKTMNAVEDFWNFNEEQDMILFAFEELNLRNVKISSLINRIAGAIEFKIWRNYCREIFFFNERTITKFIKEKYAFFYNEKYEKKERVAKAVAKVLDLDLKDLPKKGAFDITDSLAIGLYAYYFISREIASQSS